MILRGPIPSSASDLRLRLFFFPSGELDGRSFCKQTLRCVELFVRSLEGRIAIHSFFCASGNRQIALWRPRSFRGSFFYASSVGVEGRKFYVSINHDGVGWSSPATLPPIRPSPPPHRWLPQAARPQPPGPSAVAVA